MLGATGIGRRDESCYQRLLGGGGVTSTTVIGMNLANITNSAVTADITLVNNDGPNISIVKSAPIPVGGSLVAIGGDQKLVMEASDIIKVKSSAATSIDVALSILEIT